MTVDQPDMNTLLAKRFFRLALPMNLVLLGLVGSLFAVLLGPAAESGGLKLPFALVISLIGGLIGTFGLILAGAEYLRCRRQASSLMRLIHGPAGDGLRARRGDAADNGWQRDVWLGTVGLFISTSLSEIGELRLRQLISRDRRVAELVDQALVAGEAPDSEHAA